MTIDSQRPTSRIFLSGLELSIHLGWPAAERLEPQIITADIHIVFIEPPLACTTDKLEDTICYDALITHIKKQIAAQPFRLLEHVGHTLYQIIKHEIKQQVRISVRVTKKPPILNLTGGVSFCYSDEEYSYGHSGTRF